jgi:hypothetical protein
LPFGFLSPVTVRRSSFDAVLQAENILHIADYAEEFDVGIKLIVVV